MEDLIFLKPYCREVIWGGTRLKKEYGYETEGDHTGEAWVISTRPEGQSVVTDGPFRGMPLNTLWQKHRELFSDLPGEEFPLLVKLIDARDNLSIQVHPDDAYAAEHEHGSLGKTECWYIVDCDPGADIVIGHKAKTRAEMEEMIRNGRWDDFISILPLHKGDFFFIPSGTVHAIRKGTLILEIQQNSNVTYRVYDYNRLQDGKPRALHIQQSIDVIKCPADFRKTEETPVSGKGFTAQILVRCPLFTVQKWSVETDTDAVVIPEEDGRFLLVDIVEGEGAVNGRPVHKGEHFIAPTGFGKLSFTGRLVFVVSRTGK